MIHIYTDGSCLRNPGGAGGFGVILIAGNDRKEISQGYHATTNNRMELLSVIPVTIYSDSRYVVDSIDKRWVFGWHKKGWPDKIKNVDLWKRFLDAYRDHRAPVKAVWVRGHNGHAENERCDHLAETAARSHHKLNDHGFQQSSSKPVNNSFRFF